MHRKANRWRTYIIIYDCKSKSRRMASAAHCGTIASPRAARRSTREGTPLATLPTSGSTGHPLPLPNRPLRSRLDSAARSPGRSGNSSASGTPEQNRSGCGRRASFRGVPLAPRFLGLHRVSVASATTSPPDSTEDCRACISVQISSLPLLASATTSPRPSGDSGPSSPSVPRKLPAVWATIQIRLLR